MLSVDVLRVIQKEYKCIRAVLVVSYVMTKDQVKNRFSCSIRPFFVVNSQ